MSNDWSSVYRIEYDVGHDGNDLCVLADSVDDAIDMARQHTNNRALKIPSVEKIARVLVEVDSDG